MRIDKNSYGENAATVCGKLIVVDASGGQGHCWETIHEADFLLADEISAEMIDGKRETCDDYVASDGQHYAW